MSVVAGWVAVSVTLACPHSGPGRTAEEADFQSNQKKKQKNENGKWPTGSTGCNNDGGGSSSGVGNSDDNCSSSRVDDVVW